MTPEEIHNYFENIKTLVLEYSPKFVVAIIILLVGLWTTSFITRTAKKIMLKRKVEVTLSTFIGNLIFWTLRVLLFVTVISKLGIETSSFVAILGAAGLAIGLSLQGSLSNFAGGILIILFKPFRIGDIIEAQGVQGTVDDIKIFSTVITSPDNKQIVIPNAVLSNGVIINHTIKGIRRIEIVITVDYKNDLPIVKSTIENILKSIPEILSQPQASVYVLNLGANAIDFAVKPYVKNENLLKVKSEILEKTKIAFDKIGIEMK
ncbi:mechanosensitive ion channel [Flavobacterium sp. HXWNR69]|uniref:Mechanosensitive ion channel n=1 Tax=Flavobacterium fragile TaxID=2949085 RepID=A0ABT0TDB4_9FLAO|nr:mechanosensitive ion channel domain-containing protein [Flavobacterium sp. HXWNR69]MCL9768956.1 mechanosensitive ion channel [Flavobacterium sp. HXWNR69]